MNLDHEAGLIVVVVRLYLAGAIEAMLWIEKYFFVYKLWIQAIGKTISGLSLEVVAILKQLWIGPNH
jgi:hypothetical protein